MATLLEHWPFVTFVLAVLALMFLSRLLLRAKPLPYDKRDAVMTNTELEFYQVLFETAGDDWTILAMVRLADLIVVKEDTPKRQSWQNRINSKHIDFVLCDAESLEPQVVIELDDRSHERSDRKERDRFINDAMQSAGLPLVRIKVAQDYDGVKLRREIDAAAQPAEA